jgi:hypothetical protein
MTLKTPPGDYETWNFSEKILFNEHMLQMLLMLIAIFLFASLGQAFDSQRNNKDIFQNMWIKWYEATRAQANFYTNPQKSETNDRSAFERFSVPISNDGPASTISSFLSQLTVVPTSSFSHFHIPTNATNTATGLTSLNDVNVNVILINYPVYAIYKRIRRHLMWIKRLYVKLGERGRHTFVFLFQPLARAAATERHTYRVEVSSHPSRRKRCRPSMVGKW